MPEGGLPMMSSDGGPEVSPRESMDTSGALPSANSSAGHRRNSVGETSRAAAIPVVQAPFKSKTPP